MSDELNAMFAEMFGGTKKTEAPKAEPAKTEAPKQETQKAEAPKQEPPKGEPAKAEPPREMGEIVEPEKDDALYVDGESDENDGDSAPAETPKAEETPEEVKDEPKPDTTVTKEQYEKMRKDMCSCGAAFAQEMLMTSPWVVEELKKGKKTLQGFYNYCYTYFLDKYVKENGRVNGGAWCDIERMARRYFSDEVAEGTVFKADNVNFTKPAPKANPAPSAAKTVAKVAKKAAKAAKKLPRIVEKQKKEEEKRKAEEEAHRKAEDNKASLLAKLSAFGL